MLYQIHADMGRTEDVDLDGDGVPETRRPEIKIMTVEAGSGDEAAAKAMTMGAKFVRGVAPAAVQPVAASPVASVSAAADLLAKAESMPFLSFKSLAAKILGSEMPGTKAEIIVALHAKAA